MGCLLAWQENKLSSIVIHLNCDSDTDVRRLRYLAKNVQTDLQIAAKYGKRYVNTSRVQLMYAYCNIRTIIKT